MKTQTNRGEPKREEAEETDEHLYKLNGFQGLCAIVVQLAQKCTSCLYWMANAYAYLFAGLALDHFDGSSV